MYKCYQGRPLFLGEKLDCKVKSYMHAVHETGGPVTNINVLSAGKSYSKSL